MSKLTRGAQELAKLAKNKQPEIAKRLRVSQSWISRVARGDFLPNMPLALRLADEGIDPNWWREPPLPEQEPEEEPPRAAGAGK